MWESTRTITEKKTGTNVEESRSPRHQLRAQHRDAVYLSSHGYTHGDLIWDDVLFRYRLGGLSCLLLSAQATNTATKKIDFLPLAIRLGLCARTRLYAAPNAPRARIPGVGLSLSRSTLRASSETRECDKRTTDGPRPGTSIKIADQW